MSELEANPAENVIKPGDFVVVQRQGYTKLHRMKNQGGILQLGHFNVEMDNVLGARYFDCFQMKNLVGKKRLFTLEKAERVESTLAQIKGHTSGVDNRNIEPENGSSGSHQKISAEEISRMKNEALSSNNIVGKLIDNSRTFHAKTGYSQEKYIRKKEHKYFEYVQIRKPSIRILAAMFYRQDPAKILGIRSDDLSQILTYANVQPEGVHLLYDSGTSGLIPASILNAIGAKTQACLIHTHPGNECQRNAMVAMQFPGDLMERCINVNLYSVLRHFYQNKENSASGDHNDSCHKLEVKNRNVDGSEKVGGEGGSDDSDSCQEAKRLKIDDGKQLKFEDENIDSKEGGHDDSCPEPQAKKLKIDDVKNDSQVGGKGGHEDTDNCQEVKKLKIDNVNKDSQVGGLDDSCQDDPQTRKQLKIDATPTPSWMKDNERACQLLRGGVDSLIITAKEHPVSIVSELIKFLKGGRNLVVFSTLREPLLDLYNHFKSNKLGTDTVVSIKIFNNFTRNYQVLPERTHPEVNMTSGGYILTAVKLVS